MKRPRRPHRFKRDEYAGRMAAFTLCVDGRAALFTSEEIFQAMVAFLRDAAAKHNCLFPAFCFMPDHAHILVMPADDEANTLDAIDKFRLQSGIWLFNHKLPRWQRGSWDDTIGTPRTWREQARYIILNPVRAGFVESWADYPYLGNLHGEVGDLFQ